MIPQFLRRLSPKPVPNSGSQLRDHQANERTFLSWTRMGLAFAAMALALGRLSLIDEVFNPTRQTGRDPRSKESRKGQQTQPSNATDIAASRLCQVVSVWSLGYGFFRYVSVRKNLLKGQFVPAIWGPVFMTCGTLGVFGSLIQMDWRRHMGDE